MKQKQMAVVLSQREIASGIYDMWIGTGLAAEALPGQFICVYPRDKSILLPRPISVCEVAEDKAALRIVYRVAGQGTAEFSSYKEGEGIAILGMLGNGFPVGIVKAVQNCPDKFPRVFLMGGGIGIPPMLQLAKELSSVLPQENIQIIAGYRDSQTFLKEDLEKNGVITIATEDGSVGTKGNVMDAIRRNDLTADIIFACGPLPMLRAIKRYAEERGIPAYISLEEHMACGVGACLGCVVKTRGIDRHSHVHNARICTDGPVFEAKEVEI